MTRPRVALAIVCAVFLAVSLADLDTLPAVYGDETWTASASFKLARTGEFGSDLFTGHYNAEHHMYMWPPLFVATVAGSFRLLGVGVLQMRLPAVLCGLLVLLVTYAVGRQVGGARAGLLAGLLLLTLRLASGWDHATGIPLLDLARISRYDIMVPVFGLLALWIFNRAELDWRSRHGARRGAGESGDATRRRLNYLGTGIAIGLASLAHLYGAFWLPALLLSMLLRRGWKALWDVEALAMVAGFALPWIPWLAYAAAGWHDFVGQQQAMYAGRYSLGELRFYLTNLAGEVYRYRQLAPRDPTDFWFLRQLGTWIAVLGVPVALLVMLATLRSDTRAGKRRVVANESRAMTPSEVQRSRDDAAYAVALCLLVQQALFALLVSLKMYNYIIALWPLAVLALAWLGLRLWDRAAGSMARLALVLVLAAIATEAVVRIAGRHGGATQVVAYDTFMRRVALLVPQDARVLGMQRQWLALHDREYRSWLLPFFLANRPDTGISLDAALDRMRADVVLVDDEIGGYFERLESPSHPYHDHLPSINAFFTRRGARLAGVVSDTTYGTIRVYRLER